MRGQNLYCVRGQPFDHWVQFEIDAGPKGVLDRRQRNKGEVVGTEVNRFCI